MMNAVPLTNETASVAELIQSDADTAFPTLIDLALAESAVTLPLATYSFAPLIDLHAVPVWVTVRVVVVVFLFGGGGWYWRGRGRG